MSDLQRKLLLAKLPPTIQSNVLPGMPRSSMQGQRKGPIKGKRDYTPVAWNHYFEKVTDVKVDQNDTFRVYESGTSGPVCFFLHGGGFSALSWAVLTKSLTSLVTCRCAAMDLRGHGDTRTADEHDLSADILTNDVANVIEKLYGDSPPPIILIGHSMGGAIAVHTVCTKPNTAIAGLIVIDVVEGSAMEALGSMQSFLRGRPMTFKSLEGAIEYCVRSGQIRNLESAKVSIVGQVRRIAATTTDTSAILDLEGQQQTNGAASTGGSVADDVLTEENESLDGTAEATPTSVNHPPSADHPPSSFKQPSSPGGLYEWRIDLTKTEKYWKGWFEGMSKMFLSCIVPKMLLLAGVDRLDKELTVGQMQGKFQMQVMPQCGHTVHEDNPEKVADVFATFLVRNRMAEPTEHFHRTFPA